MEKWVKRVFFNGLDAEQTEPSGPTAAQQLSKVLFKGMSNLSKASRITRVLKVKHRLKTVSLAVGQRACHAGHPCCLQGFWDCTLGPEPTLLVE